MDIFAPSKWIRRIIILAGIGAAVIACATAFIFNEPSWFKEAICETARYLVFSLVVIAAVGELVDCEVSKGFIRFSMLVLTGIATGVPSLYLLIAAFPGREIADVNTWHLLPLFAVINQIIFSIATVSLLLVTWLLMLAVRLVKKVLPNKKLKATDISRR